MKIYVTGEELTKDAPRIAAIYADDTDVPKDAHPSAQMFYVSVDSIMRATDPGGMPTLAKDWRERSERAGVLSQRERIDTVYELVTLLLKNESDLATWPSPDRDRYNAIKRKWDLAS